MNKKIKIISIIVIILIAVVYYTIGFIEKDRKIDKLKANHITLPNAYITKFTSYRRLITVYYAFTYNAKTYSGYRSLGGIDPSNESAFWNHTFAVMVDTTDPMNNAILITPHHFSKMNWGYPDSLKWVLKYYSTTFGSW